MRFTHKINYCKSRVCFLLPCVSFKIREHKILLQRACSVFQHFSLIKCFCLSLKFFSMLTLTVQESQLRCRRGSLLFTNERTFHSHHVQLFGDNEGKHMDHKQALFLRETSQKQDLFGTDSCIFYVSERMDRGMI